MSGVTMPGYADGRQGKPWGQASGDFPSVPVVTPVPAGVSPAPGLEPVFPGQASTTTGTIIGRRRCVWLTHDPTERRIRC